MVHGKVLAFLALQIVLVTSMPDTTPTPPENKVFQSTVLDTTPTPPENTDSGQMTTEGRPCVFPFIYKGVTYRSCTTKNHNRPWCSTTANYDKEGQWGNCEVLIDSGKRTTEGEDCVFPFIYKGVTYKSCTTKNHNRPWCSTTANYDKEEQWGNCEGFSSSGTWTTLFRPIFWGGSEYWEYCVFPFIYKGVLYKSCTTKNHDRPWCSTTVNYDKDEKWGNCAGFSSSVLKTTSDEYCAFPFTYHGEEYHSCITKNHNRPWCSTTTKYDKDLKRGDCKAGQT